MIDEVMGLLTSTTDPRISISSNCSENLWTIEADGTQVEQVIMNLCVNAIDAIDCSDGRIEIKTQNVSFLDKELNDKPGHKTGEYVMIVVSDNGTGMSSETKTKLFEPFFTTKEQGKGTGLGLSTSYGIVEQHGGWIECDSDLTTILFMKLARPRNFKTTFYFYNKRTCSISTFVLSNTNLQITLSYIHQSLDNDVFGLEFCLK